MSARRATLSLYRRSLKLTLDWAVQRRLWRGQALYIRSLFEANRNVSDPRQVRVTPLRVLARPGNILIHTSHPLLLEAQNMSAISQPRYAN
ncbi:hypothetical protein CP532_1968, partial [Ophiocordyceps camponoti-leonardi (nom. inval.)]